MGLNEFRPNHLREDQAGGLLGGAAGAFGGGLQSEMAMAQRQAAMSSLSIEQLLRNSAVKGALRDGTGKEVNHPETFIEELQAETNEWLEGVFE